MSDTEKPAHDVTEPSSSVADRGDAVVSLSLLAEVVNKPGTPLDLDALEEFLPLLSPGVQRIIRALIERVRRAERERDELREAVKGVMELPRADVEGQELFAEGYNIALYKVAMYLSRRVL